MCFLGSAACRMFITSWFTPTAVWHKGGSGCRFVSGQHVPRRGGWSGGLKLAHQPPQGRQQDAEAQWDTACTSITTGCAKYQDKDWLLRIRR